MWAHLLTCFAGDFGLFYDGLLFFLFEDLELESLRAVLLPSPGQRASSTTERLGNQVFRLI